MKKLWKRIFMDKEQRAYNKMYRRHRKAMIKLAKQDADFDWDYLHNLVILKIKHMHEYYSKGDCVWQSDETLLPIIEQLQHILDLEKELDTLWENATDTDVDAIDDLEDWLNKEISDEQREKWRLATVREHEIYKEIYAYIGEYIQEWWD